MKLLFIALQIFFFPICQAEEVCRFSGQLGPIDTENQEFVRIAQSAAVIASSNDLKNFCIWNRMGRTAVGLQGDFKNKYAEARAEGDSDEAANVILQYGRSKGQIDNPWFASMTGHPLLKKQSILAPLSPENLRLNIDEAGKYAVSGKLYGSDVNKDFSVPKRFTEPRKPLATSFLKETAACAYIAGALKTANCLSDLAKIKDYATPTRVTNFGITAVPSFAKILGEESYEKGLKLATTRMYNKLRNLDGGEDLFSEIKSAFIDSGDSKNSAEEKTWEVMAVLSATGPNMGIRVQDKIAISRDKNSVNPNAIFLSAIAAMIPHLDTLAMLKPNPRTYSLPPNVKFSCDSGKPYHFWYSAYLSRMLLKGGSTPDSAASSTYLAELGYQTHSQTDRRDASAVTSLQRFGNAEIGIQMDLNLAAAGAIYGAAGEQRGRKNINLEENFRRSISQMGTAPSLPKEQSRFNFANSEYSTWLDNYNPIATLENYR